MQLMDDTSSTEIYTRFFFNDTATTEIYTLSLHDALPIFQDAYTLDISGTTPRPIGGMTTALTFLGGASFFF